MQPSTLCYRLGLIAERHEYFLRWYIKASRALVVPIVGRERSRQGLAPLSTWMLFTDHSPCHRYSVTKAPQLVHNALTPNANALVTWLASISFFEIRPKPFGGKPSERNRRATSPGPGKDLLLRYLPYLTTLMSARLARAGTTFSSRGPIQTATVFRGCLMISPSSRRSVHSSWTLFSFRVTLTACGVLWNTFSHCIRRQDQSHRCHWRPRQLHWPSPAARP